MFEAIKRLLGFAPPDPDSQEANYYAQIIVQELNRMGKCYVKKTKDGGIFQEVRFKPPLKILPDRIELEVDAPRLPYGIAAAELKEAKIIESLETVCKRPVSVKHEKGSGFWYVIKRYNTSKPNFEFADLRPHKTYDPTKTPLFIPIGRTDTGDQVWRDLERIYHLLIAGATGMGKTRQIHSIVSWLITKAQPNHVRLILVDLKEGLDLNRYNGVPHLQFPVAIEPLAAYNALKWVNDEISRRGELFREVNAENIHTYRQRTGRFLNNIVVVFDEITNIQKLRLIGHKDKVAEADFYLRDGAQRARALGVHFIISTQRPSVEVIDGDIKMNFTARIGFGTATDVDSRVILDNNMAAGLEVGDLIYQDSGSRGMLLRGPYLGTDEVDRLVATIFRKSDVFKKQELLEQRISAIKRQEQIEAMLNYAVTILDGDFSREKLHPIFSGQLTKGEFEDIAKELEEAGILAPAAGRRPRQVLPFVACRLSPGDNNAQPPLSAQIDPHPPANGNGCHPPDIDRNNDEVTA